MYTREQLEKKFSISRANLLAVIIFTCINIILTITNTDLYFLFSANIPMIFLYFGSELIEITGNFSFSALGITAAFIAAFVYGIFWYFSKKHRGLIVAALVYFSLDILIMAWLITSTSLDFDFSLIVELAFIAWIMYYLVTGTRAWFKLRKMPPDEEPVYDGQDESGQSEQGEVKETVVEHKTIPVAQMPLSTAIRPSYKKGKVMISQNYNNMEIIVKRALGVTELIVDGMVYAEKTGVSETKSYILEANVNGVIINCTMKILTVKEAIHTDTLHNSVYLYVNGNLLAEKARYF